MLQVSGCTIIVFQEQVLMDLFAALLPMDSVINIQLFLTVSTHTTLNQKSQKSNDHFQQRTRPFLRPQRVLVSSAQVSLNWEHFFIFYFITKLRYIYKPAHIQCPFEAFFIIELKNVYSNLEVLLLSIYFYLQRPKNSVGRKPTG